MQERPENVPLDPALTHTATWVALSEVAVGGWRLVMKSPILRRSNKQQIYGIFCLTFV